MIIDYEVCESQLKFLLLYLLKMPPSVQKCKHIYKSDF